MTLHNIEIAARFNRLADLLEIENENPFRIRAYRNAARLIAGLPHEMSAFVAEGKDLTELPGIGEALAEKIVTLLKTGELPPLKRLEKRVPASLSELMQMPGLGPKRVRMLYYELRIATPADLERAIRRGKLRALHGFGPKIETALKAALAGKKTVPSRVLLTRATLMAETFVAYLKTCEGVGAVTVAGSYRRRQETIGDLDILVTARKGTRVTDHFVRFDEVAAVVSKGVTRSTVRLRSGLHVDLRVVTPASYGAALHYFTGAKAHNIAVRKLAVRRGFKLNEYGVFKGKKRLAGRTEQEVYAQVGLPYIEPELREDRGEIEAAQADRLPLLITPADLRGDLHCHTRATDGLDTLEAMVDAARARGYAYLAITDHSQRLTVAHGLDKKRLFEQIEAIDRLNARMAGAFRILKGCEVDILEDGSLDLPNEALRALDVTVCSVHSKFNLPADKQTERIIRAMDNPHFHILAHPTGRLLFRREPYAVDIEKVLRAAHDRGCFLELNTQPDRMDLNDLHCQAAKAMGVRVVISSDAHSVDQLANLPLGIGQARRGWLEAQDVLNTRPLGALLSALRRNP